MLRTLARATLVGVILAPAVPPAAAAGAATPVALEGVRGAGTAWPTPSGLVVTNHHLVDGRETVTLVDAEGTAFDARVAATDPANDVAILIVDRPERLPPGLPLRSADLRLGAGVFTLGFPRVDVMGTSPKLSTGVVSGLTGMLDDPDGFLVSVPIQPGNSGGPLLDMRGEVVGMVVSMVAAPTGESGDLQPLPGVNCAVRSGAVAALLAGIPAPLPHRPAVATPTGAADLEALVARVERSVLIVLAR